jgi:type IV secretion system protein TrbL
MASAGAKGAVAATGGAVKAGASMVGGSKVGFALGKMAAGGSGVKGAIGGLGGVAQTGAMAVVRKGADMASKAGGAVSSAHTRGMHGGLRATTKGMNPLPKAGGGNKGEPNWAKKAHRQQKTRSAGRTASNAIRGADRGGSGSGPSLNPDG